jgi:phosphoglycerate dehydrogenase-like enzyme
MLPNQEQIYKVIALVLQWIVFGGLDPELYRNATKLRWIQYPSAGVDSALTPEFVASDVILTSSKGEVGVHLAEHAMALLLALTRGIGHAVRALNWSVKMGIRNRSWELPGRVIGIVGLGGTGRELAARAAAFGMKVIAVDPETVDVPSCVESCWRMDRFHHLLGQSDVVAICAPLTPETEGLFDHEAFNHMQSHALLINVTRGKIVDDHALIEALRSKSIAGAGLDVTPVEPLPPDHPLWNMENVVITPHTAGASPERNRRTVDLFCENLRRYRAGQPLLDVIDKAKGY